MVPLHLLQRKIKISGPLSKYRTRLRIYRDDYWYDNPAFQMKCDYKKRPLTGDYTNFPQHGYIITAQEYRKLINRGGLVTSDGHGHPVRDNRFDPNIYIYPMNVGEDIPRDATHIEWYPTEGD